MAVLSDKRSQASVFNFYYIRQDHEGMPLGESGITIKLEFTLF